MKFIWLFTILLATQLVFVKNINAAPADEDVFEKEEADEMVDGEDGRTFHLLKKVKKYPLKYASNLAHRLGSYLNPDPYFFYPAYPGYYPFKNSGIYSRILDEEADDLVDEVEDY